MQNNLYFINSKVRPKRRTPPWKSGSEGKTAAGQRKLVSWMVSNCNTKSKRKFYVQVVFTLLQDIPSQDDVSSRVGPDIQSYLDPDIKLIILRLYI